jgi:hypothetical protein
MIITAVRHTTDFMGQPTNTVIATIDGEELFVPLDPSNRHYSEILHQVEAGTLTIQEAD